MIDHQDAVKGLMAERYLLGELNASEREAYEEHLFSCDACFEQVKAGTEFVGHLSRMGKDEPVAVVPGFMNRLITSLRQPLTVAACALLACVSGLSVYQRGIIAGLRQAQVMPSLFLSDGAKAGGTQQITVAANTRFYLAIQVLQNENFSSYEGEVLNESKHRGESFPISAEETKETIHVLLDSGKLGPGNYLLVINGLTPDGRKTEVTRYKFQVLLKE
ncbi:MAG TPA: zf-HC2 domain-containing protein [Candidatus Angelobacter sp.]|nr:zf-HC2 domain-containing protein [Candidatus Angelobacter sp.]